VPQNNLEHDLGVIFEEVCSLQSFLLRQKATPLNIVTMRQESGPIGGVAPRSSTPGKPTGQFGQFGRRLRRPTKLRDFVSHGVGRLFAGPTASALPEAGGASSSAADSHIPEPHIAWQTAPDIFGLFREYIVKPSYIPDLHPFAAKTPATGARATSDPTPSLADALGPFPNYSTFLHAKFFWMNESNTLSDGSNIKLVKEVYHDPYFCPTDVSSTGVSMLKSNVAAYQAPSVLRADHGWKTSSVNIKVPLGLQPRNAPRRFGRTLNFAVPGPRHRSLLGVIKRTLTTDPHAVRFHLFPFKKLYRPPESPPDSPPVPVYDEIYSSKAMLDEYTRILASPGEPGCELERAVVALQFWSDATHLTNFGSAKLWPIYGCFGNQPKSDKCKPTTHACHDVAYIPSV
jgi:hypothetical protein